MNFVFISPNFPQTYWNFCERLRSRGVNVLGIGDASYDSLAPELKANLGKYLLLAATEDVFITQYGKIVAKLTNPFQNRVEIAESLFGILPQTMTLEEAREARLNEA